MAQNHVGDLISRKELLGLERLLTTDIVKKDKAARYILEQVLFDIEHAPTAFDKSKVIKNMRIVGKAVCTVSPCNEKCGECPHGLLMDELIHLVEGGGVK